MNEEKNGRAITGREDIKQAARPISVTNIQMAIALRAQRGAAPLVTYIDFLPFGMALPQRVLRFQSFVYFQQCIIPG